MAEFLWQNHCHLYALVKHYPVCVDVRLYTTHSVGCSSISLIWIFYGLSIFRVGRQCVRFFVRLCVCVRVRVHFTLSLRNGNVQMCREKKRNEWHSSALKIVWICLRSVDAAISSPMRWTVGALSGKPFYALSLYLRFTFHSVCVDSVRKLCDQNVKQPTSKKKMFINDLSIELETVHIMDDFGTHKRPKCWYPAYTCIRHKSKSFCRTFRFERKMEEQQQQLQQQRL